MQTIFRVIGGNDSKFEGLKIADFTTFVDAKRKKIELNKFNSALYGHTWITSLEIPSEQEVWDLMCALEKDYAEYETQARSFLFLTMVRLKSEKREIWDSFFNEVNSKINTHLKDLVESCFMMTFTGVLS